MKKIQHLKRRFSPFQSYDFNVLADAINEVIDALHPEGEKCLQPVPLYDGVGGVKGCQNTTGSCPVHDLKGCTYPNTCSGICGGHCPQAKRETELAKSSPQPVSTVEGWRKDFLLTFYVYNLKKGSPAGAHLEAVEFIENIIAQARTDERARAYKTVRNFIGRQRVGNSWICDMCEDTGMVNEYTREDGGYVLDSEEVCLCKKI